MKVSDIENNNSDHLLDADINPTGNLKKDLASYKEYYCVISRMSGIIQFRQGITSIDQNIVVKGCCTKNFFVDENSKVSLDEVRKVISFERGEEGSNEFESCEDAVIEFEIFLADLERGKDGVSLKDFLIFASGYDRIPVFGLSKPIEIFFIDDNKLPIVSTCGLYIQLSKKITADKLKFCVIEGIGYGLV